MANKKRATYLKLCLLIAVGLINIADRTEKVIYLLIDLALNASFLCKVKRELIANGLRKYELLFNFNASAVFISLSMDILIIVIISLPNPFLYAIFHPVAYSVKLIIEIIMADLIAKVVQSQNEMNSYRSTSNTDSTRVAGMGARDHHTVLQNQGIMPRRYESVRDVQSTRSLEVRHRGVQCPPKKDGLSSHYSHVIQQPEQLIS
ncbi:hypothetical protein ACJ41O_013091 [Fusarium nematophilum]